MATCLLSGLVAAVACFLSVRARPANAAHALGLGVTVLAVIVAALLMASFMSVLHIPTGH